MLERTYQNAGKQIMDKYVVVIGAANIDIGGFPYNDLIKADSNPGHINISYGGVGRNIAENLSKLGVNVKLIAAIGKDPLGRDLADHCRKCGIDTSYFITDPDHNSSMYIFINDREGDMALALSDVDIADAVTPEYIESIEDVINNAEAVVMDCNISEAAYKKIKEICKVPLYVDPVSQTHASKIKNDLSGIDIIKPNRMEAEYLTDMIIKDETDYVKAADYFFSKGIQKIFISMGEKGIFAASDDKYYIVDSYPSDVVSTTGAGDSATAAIVWSLLTDEDIIKAARSANAAASVTVRSDKTISSELDADKILELSRNRDIMNFHEIKK